jgi:hypothetical protein
MRLSLDNEIVPNSTEMKRSGVESVKIKPQSKKVEIEDDFKIKYEDSFSDFDLRFPIEKSKSYKPDRTFKDFVVAFNVRRFTHLSDYFEIVVGFELDNSIYKLKISQYLRFEEHGFLIYRAAQSSFYIFVKKEIGEV